MKKIVIVAFDYEGSRSLLYRTHESDNYDSLIKSLVTALDRDAKVISIRVLQTKAH